MADAGSDNSVAFDSPAAWEAWLDENHADSCGVWVRIAKKASGLDSVRYPEVLDVAIGFGWIDGQRRALDADWFLQRFTPRRARSQWSQINRKKAETLASEGRMRPAGHAEVQRAKEDGRWEAAYASQSRMEVPGDLRGELAARPRAAAAFDELSAQNRFAIICRLADAKRPATRERRLEKFVAMLEAGETLYP